MKISFLVTYYNQEQFVQKSMDSILALNCPCDFEILVGDDGSSDNTVAEINRYIESYPGRIQLYVMPRESGKKYDSILRVSANRLNLLSHASGDFFCILDGDDWYCDTNFVADAISEFAKDKFLSVCAFNFQLFYSDSEVVPNLFFPKEKKLFPDKYISNYYIPAGACVHRQNNTKERIEFMKSRCAYDDNDILINSLNYGNIRCIDKIIYSYRQTVGGWSKLSSCEKTVINALYYSILYEYSNYKNAVNVRYFKDFLYLIFRVKNIKQILGEDKFNKYKYRAIEFHNDFLCDILNYDEISFIKRINFLRFVLVGMVTHPIRFLSECKRWFSEIFKCSNYE